MIRTSRPNRCKGFVLIVVLGMVLLLSALLFAFNRTTRASLQIAEGLRESAQARTCARAGLGLAIATVAEVNDLSSDRRFDDVRRKEKTFPVGEGRCVVTITEESGRLNVNALKQENGQFDRRRVDQMLRLIDLLNRRKEATERIGYGVVPALIDWTDADDEPTLLPFVESAGQGVESSYYESHDPPYRCKNAPMDTIEELRWIKGISAETFIALRDLLTTAGSGRINLNAAPKLILESLSEQVDPALAQMIVQRRRLKPFETVAELREVPGMTDNIYQALRDAVEVRAEDAYYRVHSRGQIEDRTCEIEALLHRNPQTGNVDIVLYRES